MTHNASQTCFCEHESVESYMARCERLIAEGRCVACGQKCKYVRLPDGTYQDIPDVCDCHDE